MNKNSLAAYRSIGAHLDGHYLKIYEALLAGGAQTSWEISRTMFWKFEINDNLRSDQTFRRMAEMERAGWVERMDWTQESPSGRACSVWWVSTKETK